MRCKVESIVNCCKRKVYYALYLKKMCILQNIRNRCQRRRIIAASLKTNDFTRTHNIKDNIHMNTTAMFMNIYGA